MRVSRLAALMFLAAVVAGAGTVGFSVTLGASAALGWVMFWLVILVATQCLLFVAGFDPELADRLGAGARGVRRLGRQAGRLITDRWRRD